MCGNMIPLGHKPLRKLVILVTSSATLIEVTMEEYFQIKYFLTVDVAGDIWLRVTILS